MRTVYLLAARRVIIDSQENDISVISLLENFTASGFPIVMSRLAIVWALTRESSEASEQTGTVTVQIDDDAPLSNNPFALDFQNQLTSRLTLNFVSFIIPKPGQLKFEFTLSGGHRAELLIRADLLSGGTGPPGSNLPAPVGGAFLAP
jgi:hypothetical protein